MTTPWKTPRGSKKLQFIFAGISAVVAAGIIGFFFFQSLNKAPDLDKITFCPAKVDVVTAVLVDTSDELTAIQRADVKNRLDNIKEQLPSQGRIDLYAMGTDHNGAPRPLFSMCNPGTGANANALTQNARLMNRKWTRDFSDKLDDHLAQIMSGPGSAESPIMETIKAISVQSFGAVATKDASEKNLVLVSDMIQFTKQYSQFKGVDKDEFEKFKRTAYYNQIRTELRGVDVDLIYVRRTTAKNVQGSGHRTFWELFFRESGGRVSHFVPI